VLERKRFKFTRKKSSGTKEAIYCGAKKKKKGRENLHAGSAVESGNRKKQGNGAGLKETVTGLQRLGGVKKKKLRNKNLQKKPQ